MEPKVDLNNTKKAVCDWCGRVILGIEIASWAQTPFGVEWWGWAFYGLCDECSMSVEEGKMNDGCYDGH